MTDKWGWIFTRILVCTAAGVKCCVAALKSRHKYISVLLYFFLVLGINDYNTFSIGNRVPLKPVLGAVRDVALFHYLSWTNSIKPSLHISFFILVWFLSRDLLLPEFWYYDIMKGIYIKHARRNMNNIWKCSHIKPVKYYTFSKIKTCSWKLHEVRKEIWNYIIWCITCFMV